MVWAAKWPVHLTISLATKTCYLWVESCVALLSPSALLAEAQYPPTTAGNYCCYLHPHQPSPLATFPSRQPQALVARHNRGEVVAWSVGE